MDVETRTPPIRAFSVIEEYENTGGIVFARHAVAARRRGADEYADGDFTAVTCRREPWADAYVGKPIPARVMIAHGWHFECAECAARIDEDWLADNRKPLAGVIGTENNLVFCCSRCARRYFSMQRRRKAEEQRAIGTFKAIVRRRFPDVMFCDAHDNPGWRHHAYVTYQHGQHGWVWEQVAVHFTFPGMQIAPATFRLPDRPWKGCGPGNRFIGPLKPYYTCCHGDLEAFEAYAAATRVPA